MNNLFIKCTNHKILRFRNNEFKTLMKICILKIGQFNKHLEIYTLNNFSMKTINQDFWEALLFSL